MFDMMNPANFMAQQFKKVGNVVWDMATGKMGILQDDSIFTIKGEGDEMVVLKNPMANFAMRAPAFAMNTQFSDVKIGDIISSSDSSNKIFGWIKEIRKNAEQEVIGFRVMTPRGTEHSWTPPKLEIMGFNQSGVMVVKSVLSMFGGDTNKVSSFSNNLAPLMMLMGGNSSAMEEMLPLLLMQSSTTGDTSMGGMSNFMQMMFMSKMLKKMDFFGGKDTAFGGKGRRQSSGSSFFDGDN